MGCQSEVEIGENLTFSVCTHDPDTGVLTDADSVPTYRIYEDETATAITNGSMAKLDDDNTTGCYSELIACTTANGYEDGKSYTIYIEATVDSDKGGIALSFRAKAAASGAGATAKTYTVTDGALNPLDGVAVWATTDEAGNNVVASGTSDDSGEVTFYLDSGTTYYIWRQKAGWDFTNPDTEVA